ncbi:MAG: hypothetical protein ABW072_02705 [Sedimenticola sp.]
MTEHSLLGRRMAILGIVGVIAFAVDSWARANSNILISVLEMGILAMWLIGDVAEIFRGRLKAGPEIEERITAINISSFQLFISMYLFCVALAAIFILPGDEDFDPLTSPFTAWLVAVVPLSVAFIQEFFANENANKT